MDVESVDSAEGSAGFFDSNEITSTLDKPLWFGREVQLSTEKNLKLELLAQFFFANLQRMEEILNLESGADRFHIIDFQEEILEEITSNLDLYADFVYSTALCLPMNRNFEVLDPKNYQTDIVNCKNYIKAFGKGIGKGAKKLGKVGKKVGKGVAHVAKDVVHFVKEHPIECAIGAVAIGVGLGVGYYALSSLAQATSVAALGVGAAAQGAGKRREDEDGPMLNDPTDIAILPPKDPAPLSSFLSDQEKANIEKSNPFSGLSAGSSPTNTPPLNTITQFQNGISSMEFLKRSGDGKSNQPINETTAGLSPPFKMPDTHNQVPLQSVISGFLANVAHGVCNSVAATRPYIPDTLIKPYTPSCHIETEGIEYKFMRIGFINGMGNSYEDSMNSLRHIKTFVGDMKIEGVYNNSNGIAVDLAEIFLLNYGGIAPVTSDLLIENWTRFHEENINNPEAKYLQFAHSMGTILTKDALMKAPQEIRDRIIVVSIGPAVVIPKELCYESIPFASGNDIVHFGENIFAFVASGAMSNDDQQSLERYAKLIESKQQLTLLEQHPESEGMGHSFQDPTFDQPIGDNIAEYLNNNGQYR